MSWPVLTHEGAPITELTALVIDQDVQVMSLMGYIYAKVTMFEREPTPEPQRWFETKELGVITGAYAETEGNCYPLRFEGGQWVCDSAWNKEAMTQFLKEFR